MMQKYTSPNYRDFFRTLEILQEMSSWHSGLLKWLLTIVNSTKFRLPSNNLGEGLLQSSWPMGISIVDYVDLP